MMIGDELRGKKGGRGVGLFFEKGASENEKSKGRSLYAKMIDLYVQYGIYKEGLISITKKGMNGATEIAEMMKGYRDNPPKTIDGVAVTELLDYDLQIGKNLQSGENWKIELPKSNVLQFALSDG